MGLPLTGSDMTTDGLSYAANLEAGLDPLGTGGGITGVAASLSLQGSVQSIDLEGNALDPTGQTAYVATGSYGLAIVDASDFEHPVLEGQIQLPGNSTDVAVDPNLKVAAVASTTGLNLVDVSNPQQPQLLQTVSVDTALVRVKDGIAYAAVGGQIQAFDLLTGDLLQTLSVTSNSITALALDGPFLYILDAGNTLKIVDLSNPLMVARGSVTLASGATLASGSGALVVGNGVAYIGVTRFLNPPLGALSGYITAEVSNPDSPKAISGEPSSDAAGLRLQSTAPGSL
jgi:WD40 repeat protein